MTIEDLRKLGASDHTVNQELKKFADMEAFASKDFRRDMTQKIRRQSARTQSIKEKFGLGSGDGPVAVPQRVISIKTKVPFLPSPIEDMADFEASVRSQLEGETSRASLEEGPGHRDRKKAAYSGRGCDTINKDSVPGSPRGERSKVSEKAKGTVSPRPHPSDSVMAPQEAQLPSKEVQVPP